MSWKIPLWVGFSVRSVVTLIVLILLFRLLRKGITTFKVTSAIASVLALGAFWLVDVEGASRIVFLGLEIDNRIESAEKILQRLTGVEKKSSKAIEQLNSIREEALGVKNDLSVIISKEDKKFQIQSLEYDAINGDKNAYEELKIYKSESTELNRRAQIAVLSIKRFYVGATKVKNLPIYRNGPNGEIIGEDDLKTAWLIDDLKNNQRWDLRARVAFLLGDRHEIGVPEALLDAMESDSNLWVCKEALDSFVKITKFKKRDVFQFETGEPRAWYEKEKDNVVKTLKNPTENNEEDKK